MRKNRGWIVLVVPVMMLAAACGPEKKVRPSVADMQQYVEQSHARQTRVVQAPGSLFNQAGPGPSLVTDFRARGLDDILIVRVYESTNAVSSADAASDNESGMKNGINNLMGLEKHIAELPTLVDASGSRNFKGQGSTNRKTALSTTIAARVVDVLPNGNLVVSGARDVNINGENQLVVISGVLRPWDISPSNEIASSAISNLEVRVEGRGIVSSSLKPGWLFRLLTGLLPF